MGHAFKIRFDNGTYARAITVKSSDDPTTVRAGLRLPYSERALLIHAGADNSSSTLVADLKPLFQTQLAPLASQYQITVLDGGTQSGFVGLMGTVRNETGGTFPLVGVAPFNTVLYPGSPTHGNRSPLDPNHTHFALVQDGSWGTESQILVGMGQTLARLSVALLVNGGEIVRKEALMHARAGNPLLVLEGSGRVADEVVDALKRGTSNNILIETLAIGKIQVCTPETLIPQLLKLLKIGDTA